ncbi:neprilysin-1-like isoform X1 [Dermacentor andersoni]|uniref:neprilysin-1-like isoform X1 n=1 Tax=Dermacentor andersoni TaxID=34620 RepID=UPI0021550152|nr:neprilysin-1-like isoform X1 [Dermacentor andersoni]
MNLSVLISAVLWITLPTSWGMEEHQAPAQNPYNLAWGRGRYKVCRTDVCRERAKMIMDSLDTAVDPCEDFYSYACGGWVKKTKIPKTKSSYGSFNALNDVLLRTLRGILERIPIGRGHQKVTDKAAVAYHACKAVTKSDDRVDVMYDIMNSSALGDWPITMKSISHVKNFTNCSDLLLQTGFGPILRYDIGRDSKNLTSYVIQIDQMEFPVVGRNQLTQPNKMENKPILKAYKRLIMTALEFMTFSISASEKGKIADELIAFEGRLARLTAPPEKRRDFFSLYHRTTITVLQQNFSTFPLLDLLNWEFSKADIMLSEDETVEIYALDYYKKLVKFLETTNPELLYNYIGLRTMLMWAPHASRKIRDALFEVKKATSGVLEMPPRWQECTVLINSAMMEITGYLYVKEKFSAEAKSEVEDLVFRLKEIFRETLEQSKWMDDVTRQKALRKLEKMDSKIAYPKWGLDMKYLEKLYEYVPQLDPTSTFLKIWHFIAVNNGRRKLEKLRKRYKKDLEWINGAAVVNAFYDPATNEMVYPSGILQGVFYQYGLPRSINFGAIGTVVGHEMTHGFDDTGSQFDANGRLEQWWTNETRSKFDQKALCFKRQYGSIAVKTLNMTLNGNNTVGENIADNGGIRTAFKAYNKLLYDSRQLEDTRLEGLEEFSGKKLFFISNAMVWCNKARDGYLRELIQYDPHSPNRYRINVPMGNMEAFSTVFKCSKRSAMYRQKKDRCILW